MGLSSGEITSNQKHADKRTMDKRAGVPVLHTHIPKGQSCVVIAIPTAADGGLGKGFLLLGPQPLCTL